MTSLFAVDPNGTPEDHILVQPGIIMLSRRLDVELVNTVWYATSAKKPSYLFPDGERREVIKGLIEHFSTRGYQLRRRMDVDLSGDHILVSTNGLRVCATWTPRQDIHGRTGQRWIATSTMGDIQIVGYVRKDRIVPFTTFPFSKFIPYETLTYLHQTCRAGRWFRFDGVLFFTDHRDAVTAKLHLASL